MSTPTQVEPTSPLRDVLITLRSALGTLEREINGLISQLAPITGPAVPIVNTSPEADCAVKRDSCSPLVEEIREFIDFVDDNTRQLESFRSRVEM